MLFNPLRRGLLWLAGFTLLTAWFIIPTEGWGDGLRDLASYTVGYLLLGVIVNSLSQAWLVQQQNTRLLDELQAKNRQLEDYARQVETLAAAGRPLGRVASVASFFLSRIDVLLDPVLDKKKVAGGPQAGVAARLQGQIAIASAKAAYQMYKEIFSADRFARLAAKGAGPQRLLWASTSTKNPAYADTMYVEALIGPDTIDTVPVETLTAYRDHGHPAQSLDQDVPAAFQALSDLSSLGIDLDAVTQQLEDEGVKKFSAAFDQLMASLKEKGG